VRVTVDVNGTRQAHTDYYPFGMTMPTRNAVIGAVDARFKFTGKERDAAETGWNYFGARYYDSWGGRFTMRDPLSQYTSLYTYCGNNPISMIDPSGSWSYQINGIEVEQNIFNIFAPMMENNSQNKKKEEQQQQKQQKPQKPQQQTTSSESNPQGTCFIFVNLAASAGILIFGTETGVTYLINPSTGNAFTYTYVGAGLGLGTPSVVGTAEAGEWNISSPSTPLKWGWQVSASAAAGSEGASFSLSGNISRVYGGGPGYAGGFGAGVIGMITYTSYTGMVEYSKLPQKIKDIFQEYSKKK
jgi:RHS repeat-associated protein